MFVASISHSNCSLHCTVADVVQTDKRHGEGEYSWHTGDRYEGEWQLGSMSGSGTFHWHNGDHFAGDWLDGHMHGVGTKTLHNGDVITGTWEHGRQQGKGTKLFGCGDKHTGLYKDDRSVNTTGHTLAHFNADLSLRCVNLYRPV